MRTAIPDRPCVPRGLNKIAILRALQLGELLCLVPALRALRVACPSSEIVLVGLPWARAFVERYPRYVDRLAEFPGWPGLSERPWRASEVTPFLDGMQREKFDLVIQMHGGGAYVNSITALFGALRMAGFYVPGEWCPDEATFLPLPAHEPEPLQHLRLMEHLGVPAQGTHLEFPVTHRDLAELALLGPLPRLYAVVHAGARQPARRWPADRFAAVGDGLHARGLPVVLTGTNEEAALVEDVARAMKISPISVVGRTTLGSLGALVRNARIVVCNDTGVSHLCAGVGTPSVVIASGSDVKRWAPLDHLRHRVLFHDPASERGAPGAPAVAADKVLECVDGMLRRAA